MTGLPAALAFDLSLGRRGLGRLDEVRGRWLGGGGRIFARGGQLRLHLAQGGLEFGNFGRERIDLRLQPFAVGTRGSGFDSHAALFYDFPDRWQYSVNRHWPAAERRAELAVGAMLKR